MATVIQPSFALGELSEDLSGRVDLEWYGKGLELCDNFHVLASGGVTLRPGTEFVGEVPAEENTGRKTRLIPFVFNAEESYALLFTDKALRVVHDGGLVTGGNGQPFVLALPYAEAHLADLRGAQSADVLYLVHPDHPPAKLMRYGHADWRYEVLSFASRLAAPVGLTGVTSAGGSVRYAYKVTAYDKDAGEESGASAAVSVLSKNLGLEDTTITLSWQPVAGAKEYKIYKESAGMYGLVGYADGEKTGVTGATLTGVLIGGALFTRTTDFAAFRETDDSSVLSVRAPAEPGQLKHHDVYPAFYNSTLKKLFVFSPDKSIDFLGLRLTGLHAWIGVDGVDGYIPGSYSDFTVYTGFGTNSAYPDGFHGDIQAVPQFVHTYAHTFADKNYEGDYSVSPPTYENPFRGAGNYPSVVAFVQQRLCFAGTRNNPQKIWMSRSGNFENFGRSNPSRDDDAVYLSVSSSQVNWIRGLATMRCLVAMTGGAEWTIDGGGSTGGALTPASINVTQQSAYGTAGLEPLIVGQSILLAQRGFTAVRDLAYSYDVDGYVGNDLTIRAAHLLRGRRLSAWAYQNAPHGILWCARDDGVLLALTYVKEHQVFAWSRHHSDGLVEDLCVVNSDRRDELYLVVRRRVGGGWRRYLERLALPYRSDDMPMSHAWHVDCGLRYEGEPVTRLSGLNHLAGRAVAVLADGGPLDGLRVGEDGTLDLPRPASVVLVGLPYAGTIKSMRVNAGDRTGSGQGRRQAISRLTLRFRDSVGGEVGWERPGTDGGPLETQWTEIKGRTLQAANSPAEPFSGDRTIIPPLGWDTKGQFLVRQRDPLPMTLLCAIPDVTMGA